MVSGNQHCFSPASVYYTADAMGPRDEGATNAGPMMTEWTAALPLANGESISTVCEGDASNNKTYCDTAINPKSYTETY